MEIEFSCSKCETLIGVSASLVSSEISCPACEQLIVVPTPIVEVGMTLGSFRLEEQVDSNGLGLLFLATQVSMNRHVVVKVLEPQLFIDYDFSDALLQRLRVLANIDHPAVNRYLDSGNHGGLLYIANSFVDGFSIARHLDQENPLNEAEAVDVVREVATSLMEIHERYGEIHGDLKPANLMMSDEGAIKLLNFGLHLATTLPPPESPEALHGSIYYMSPERLQKSAQVDWRTDLYSLGIVLFHMLTGGVPYAGESSAEIAVQHLTGAVPPVRNFDATLTRHTQDLLLKMMATDPDNRHQSWREAIIDMEHLMAGERPPSVVMRRRRQTVRALQSTATSHRRSDRSLLVVTLVALTLAVLLLVTGWLIYSETDNHEDAIALPAATSP